MTTYCAVSTTWWGVYHVSMIAPSVRWCRSAARTHSGRFPSIARLQGIFSLPTLESLSITEPLVNSLNRVAHLEPTSSFGSSNENFQSYHASLLPRWNCESPPWILSRYLLFKAWAIYRLSESFRCSVFLLNALKDGSIASSHFLAPHHVHHDYSIA
jgi:hypothetical protein